MTGHSSSSPGAQSPGKIPPDLTLQRLGSAGYLPGAVEDFPVAAPPGKSRRPGRLGFVIVTAVVLIGMTILAIVGSRG